MPSQPDARADRDFCRAQVKDLAVEAALFVLGVSNPGLASLNPGLVLIIDATWPPPAIRAVTITGALDRIATATAPLPSNVVAKWLATPRSHHPVVVSLQVHGCAQVLVALAVPRETGDEVEVIASGHCLHAP